MKKIFFILLVILLSISKISYASNNLIEKTSISGKITDSKSGESLPGVSIYFPDFKTGTTTLADGTYHLDNLPKTKVLIQVTFLGYKMIAETIDLNVIKIQDFKMEESVTELNEVVVTGLSKSAQSNRTPSPITIIPSIQLIQTSSGNIIDAISKQPGVSQITTGPGIAKPVIRGLGYNRIVTLNDGIRQEGQQWGDEHGIEVDEFAVSKVEIIKGPASLTYGSDAMAGVINFISAPTLPDGEISGKVLTEYQSNNGLFAASANLAGNKNGIIWNVRYSNKMAHSYQNKYDGYVLNSGYREHTGTAIIGLNKSWGYSHLHISVYSITPGITEGNRDSITGNFVKPVALNETTEGSAIATNSDFLSYTPQIPFQEVKHSKIVSNNSFILGKSTLKATLGWQQNQRKEFGDILHPEQYGLYFKLNTVNYDFRIILPEIKNWNVTFGVNGMQQASLNKGIEFLVPEYNLFDAGIFAVAQKSYDRLELSGGLRYDTRLEKAKGLFLDAQGAPVNNASAESYQKFKAFNSTFSGVSGSFGASYQLTDKLFTKLNVSRGFRAPNIAELSSNGIHEGTIRYEIGNPNLKPESSLQLDYSLAYNLKHLSVGVDLFTNNISNFIFSHKLESLHGGDSITQGYSTFKFDAGNAILTGGEFTIDIHPHPLDWLHFENSFAIVNSIQKNQPDSSKYLPMTPAPKFASDLKATSDNIGKHLKNAYFKIGVEYYLKQDKFYAAFGTETATPAYALVNMSAGADITNKGKTLFSLFVSANNLLNVAYQSHLSRLKYAPENFTTGRTGVYDMGRNISFKLIVPFGISKMK